MKNLMKYVTLGILPVLFLIFSFSEGTTVKRPMSVKKYGDLYYYEWSGTANLGIGDTVRFYADTANNYALDPAYFLMQNKSATAGLNPWNTWPKLGVPEKLCANAVHRGAAGATLTFRTFYSDTKTTVAPASAYSDAALSSAQSVTAGTNLVVHPELSPKWNPGKFFWFAGVDGTAADTVLQVNAYPCDD